MNLLRMTRPTRHDDQFFLAEELDDRLRLLVIVPEAGIHRSVVVIRPQRQPAAADITYPLAGRTVEHQIVVEAARSAESPRLDALAHHAIRHVDQQDRVDVVALKEELGLTAVARKAVEDEPVVPVVFVETPTHNLLDDLVGHESTLAHDALDACRKLGMCLKIPTKDVAHGGGE